jgi:hypothetical protein
MTLSKAFFALWIIGALTTSVRAWADIPPDDECFAAMVGKPCSNATNDDSFQPGVCSEAMCTRATPDGSVTYTCYRCEPTEQGAGGQPNEAGAGGQTSTAGGGPIEPRGGSSAGGAASGRAGAGTAGTKSGSSPASDEPERGSDDAGGCSLAQARGGAGAVGLALTVLGFLAVAGWRRRRSLPS